MRFRKYERPRIYSFKCEDAVLSLALEKAKEDERTLPDVLNDFLSTYTTPNTTTLELERQVKGQEEAIKHEAIKLEALKARLKQKTGEIPNDIIEFYKTRSRGIGRTKWKDEEKQNYIKQTAEKLKCDVEWLSQKLEEAAP